MYFVAVLNKSMNMNGWGMYVHFDEIAKSKMLIIGL